MAETYRQKHKEKLNVSALTKLFGKSRQWYYKSLEAEVQRKTSHSIMKDAVMRKRHLMPRLGGRKLHYLLKPEMEQIGLHIGRDRFYRFLRQERLLVPHRKRHTRTTHSYKRFRSHPNLIKALKIQRPEQVWVSDITYVRTKTGFLYLNLVTDAYSKKIMGYELADNLKTESTLKALKKSIKNRRYNHSIIHHSDRGFQYCSPTYTTLLEKNNFRVSMTERYDPYENAIAERVNGILKQEFYLDKTFNDAIHAQKEVQRSIEVYNRQRPHLSCRMLTPEQAHINANHEQKNWSRNF